ncbi:MAG: AI-2E family transporter [Thermodesulfobacteriota bacterium]
MNKEAINKWVLLLLVLFISALFLSMIRQFLMAIFLAAIFSAVFYPVYFRLSEMFKGRQGLASITTVILIILVVLIPLAGLIGIITAQAVKVGTLIKPWMERQMSQPQTLTTLVESVPFVRDFELIEKIEPYRREILSRLGEVVSGISSFLVNKLSSITFGTVNFFLMTFIMLYTMFYFFVDGDTLLRKILYYLPLQNTDERRMLDRFTSVTRATMKGTLVIGILQGGLAGLSFAAAGIPSSVFWGTLMTVLSVIPGIGSAVIWVPAAVVLVITGHVAKAIGLALFCALVVGSLDNFLRPVLVGKDTQMHELMIFFGTLGGLLMFGIPGFIIGPIIAALFVTVWDIYGVVFQDMLPPVGAAPLSSEQERLIEEIPDSESETEKEEDD